MEEEKMQCRGSKDAGWMQCRGIVEEVKMQCKDV